MEKWKFFTLPGLKLQPVASRYTDRAIPAHPYTGSMVLARYPLLLSKQVSQFMTCKRRTNWLTFYAVPKFLNPIHLYDLQIYPLFFVPDLKCLPVLLCMYTIIPHLIQVSRSLVTYRLDVSSYYFPDLKRLPAPLCMGPNMTHLIQVSISLVTYRLDVSSYYFPDLKRLPAPL
jgi:hypothetical protein